MRTGRPRLTTTGAAALLGELFGVAADDARDLGSERDQAFLVLSIGRPVAVLKVSNPAEDPEVLDMEGAAALHVHHIDPALKVARPWPVPGTPPLCTDFAYHGLTEAVAAVSPEVWLDGRSPDHVATWMPPDPYRGTTLGEEPFEAALERLGARGHVPAAVYLDTLLTSEGIVDLDPAYVRALHRRAKAAGALWVADEVQSGHGRTGEALWAFSRFGIEPDVVTLGKPMGNGHPVAAVITRSEVVQAAVGRTVLFSTFGGNPVSAAAALAVLDVIDDERVLDRVRSTGEALRAALREVAGRHAAVGDVRGGGARGRRRDRPPRRHGARPRDRGRRPRRDARPRCARRHDRPGRQRAQDPAAAGLHPDRGACARRRPRPDPRRAARPVGAKAAP